MVVLTCPRVTSRRYSCSLPSARSSTDEACKCYQQLLSLSQRLRPHPLHPLGRRLELEGLVTRLCAVSPKGSSAGLLGEQGKLCRTAGEQLPAHHPDLSCSSQRLYFQLDSIGLSMGASYPLWVVCQSSLSSISLLARPDSLAGGLSCVQLSGGPKNKNSPPPPEKHVCLFAALPECPPLSHFLCSGLALPGPVDRKDSPYVLCHTLPRHCRNVGSLPCCRLCHSVWLSLCPFSFLTTSHK